MLLVPLLACQSVCLAVSLAQVAPPRAHTLASLLAARARRYGLSKQPAARQHRARVELAIASFKLWCCTVIQLNRPKRVRCIGHGAWLSLYSLLMRFMGYVFKMLEVAEPSLHHFLNPYLVSSFVAFLHARGVRRETLGNTVAAATKVVIWLQVTSQLSVTDMAR